MKELTDFKAAIRLKDATLLRKSLPLLRARGLSERECYTYACGQDPFLDFEQWLDLLTQANATA